jgi:hypothetical protein
VISLLRNPAPDEQDLNTPGCFFEALGIDAFQELSFDQRVAFLGQILKGTSPSRRGWIDIVAKGIKEDRFDQPVDDGRLVLRSNCGVPGLDLDESRLCVMGLLCNATIPHGDTIAGLKYVGRRFVHDCVDAERLRRRPFPSRVRLQLGLASASARAIRQTRRSEQLA